MGRRLAGGRLGVQARRFGAPHVKEGAAAEGRLGLEDFSERMGTALRANTSEQLEHTTAGVETAPAVGQAGAVSSLVAVFADRRQGIGGN
jgi:hypothetical protein